MGHKFGTITLILRSTNQLLIIGIWFQDHYFPPEMQKVADATDIPVLFFQLVLIIGPFWVIFGPFCQFWVIFGSIWAILGHFWRALPKN